MLKQIARLLKPKLDIDTSEHSLDDRLYSLALDDAKKIKDMREKIEKIRVETSDKPIIKESEIARIEDQIKNLTVKAAQKLKQSIDLDPQNLQKAKAIQDFDSIIDSAIS